MRRARSLIVAAALAFGAGGCLSSVIPEHQPQQETRDGGTAGAADDPASSAGGKGAVSDGGAAATGADMVAANDPNCIPAAAPTIDGHHNPGMACLQCHDGNTAGANKFTAAGTVYDQLSLAAGAKGLSGVTIEITDANNNKVTVVTASLGAPGNFWTDQPLTFPLKVRASSCPSDRPMSEPLAANANVGAGDGNCSRSGCHDPAMIIHVP